MKLFNTLLEIKTGKKDLALKAVFIEDSLYGWEGAYYIYHYDIENNTFYINDLDYPWTENRISAINIAEQIITKAYKQEMNSFFDIFKKVQITKKPKVFCLYKQKTGLLAIDKINLKTIKWKKWVILGFKNPIWDTKDSNNVKLEKLKNNLLSFYSKKNIE